MDSKLMLLKILKERGGEALQVEVKEELKRRLGLKDSGAYTVLRVAKKEGLIEDEPYYGMLKKIRLTELGMQILEAFEKANQQISSFSQLANQ